MVDIFTRFPQYCEFYQHFWLSEPLNAITNFAFFIGAYYLYKLIKNENYNRKLGVSLIVMMVILGIGSLAWHSYRVVPTLLLDEIPIYIFIVFAFYFLIQSLTRNYKFTIILLLFTALVYYLTFAYIPMLSIFQGSLKYVFVLWIFFILNILVTHKFGSSYSFVLPLSILALALVFRIIDFHICPVFPIGTHFLWHIFVATAMYLSSTVILRLNSLLSLRT